MITNTQIDKWNSIFKNASASEKRVLIAKDVIANIKSTKVMPMSGSYIHIKRENFELTQSAQKQLDRIKKCRCCALGACLISAIKYKNTLTIEQLDVRESSQSSWDLLKGVFSPKQLLLIECAFEGDDSGMRVGRDRFKSGGLSEEEEEKCQEFYYRFKNTNRLLAIMKNIISNKGSFIL